MKTILEKIKNLNYYDGLQKVKDVLQDIFSNLTQLETNSTMLGEVIRVNTDQTSGSLIVGQVYSITTVNSGDDFTNVGRINNNAFVATQSIPNSWTNGSVVTKNERVLRVDFNDLDENYTSKTIIGSTGVATCQLTITNSKFFDPFKVFTSNITSTIINPNTILLSMGRFKLEVYN